MPRQAKAQINSASDLRSHIRQLTINLGNEVRARETALRQLREAESAVARLAGLPVKANNGRRPSRPSPKKTRINWAGVLAQLPKEFRVSDARKVRTVSHKPSSEIFSAITRWIEAGQVKRKDRGRYQRVG